MKMIMMMMFMTMIMMMMFMTMIMMMRLINVYDDDEEEYEDN